MTVLDLKFYPYRYLPYERRLAELEVKRLLGVDPEQVDQSLRVRTLNGVDLQDLERLTYFQNISIPDRGKFIPQQALLEASATEHRDPSRLSRQRTRYSAHGLHEYRGKFNPQMVRASMNLLGLEAGNRLWDPFCGSGTVLLEALHQVFDAVGVDMNPLAVAIANAKLVVVRTSPDSLRKAAGILAERIQARSAWLTEELPDEKTLEEVLGNDWLDRFRCSEYLVRWFPLQVLVQLRLILDSIAEVEPATLRSVFRIILSDIVRDVSWQDPGDLRIRRRKDPASSYPAIEMFLTTLEERVASVLAARQHLSPHQGWQRAFHGDTCNIQLLNRRARSFLEEGIDCVLSSPPYATALPYIDTQRLSIALLDLAAVKEIRQLDTALVGSREVSTRERQTLEESIEENQAGLTTDVWELCKGLKAAYAPASDGFRRQNKPAVVYRYFAGMTRAMAEATQYLRSGGWLAFIVGPNRTTLGGELFLIDTPTLLASIGEHVGLELVEQHELDTYRRYDVHSRNSIREERLVIMRKP